MEEIPVGKFGYLRKQTVDWFLNHLSIVVTAGVVVVTGMFIAARFVGWLRGDSQVDYVAANLAYNKLESNREALSGLEKWIRRHPELHAKYDAAIAQKLLSSSESGLASGYASATLKRIGGFSPHYTQFSRTTLTITDGKLAEALAESKKLKAGMEEDLSFWDKRGRVIRYGSLLYAYNLLRIAMLEKTAGSPEGELSAWRDLKKCAGWQDAQPDSIAYDPEAYLLIQENFHKQDISLLDYIKYREEKIATILKTP